MDSTENNLRLPPPSLLPPPDGIGHPTEGVTPGEPSARAAPSAGVPERAVQKVLDPQPDRHPSRPVDDDLPAREWMFAAAKDAATYPWREGGWASLIPGVLMSVFLSIGSMVPLIGLFALVFFVGYFGKFYLNIISSTINGSASLPAWPEISNWSDDISTSARQIVGAALISYAPAILYHLFAGSAHGHPVIMHLLNFFAHLYYPMACISLVMDNGFLAAMPHRVLPAIVRAMPGYLLCVLMQITFMNLVPAERSTVFVIPYLFQLLILTLLSMYIAFMQARSIGLVARKYRDQIGWG